MLGLNNLHVPLLWAGSIPFMIPTLAWYLVALLGLRELLVISMLCGNSSRTLVSMRSKVHVSPFAPHSCITLGLLHPVAHVQYESKFLEQNVLMVHIHPDSRFDLVCEKKRRLAIPFLHERFYVRGLRLSRGFVSSLWLHWVWREATVNMGSAKRALYIVTLKSLGAYWR